MWGKKTLSDSHMLKSIELTDVESDLNTLPTKQTHNVGLTFKKYI